MKLCRSRRNAVPARWHLISLNTKRKSCTRNHRALHNFKWQIMQLLVVSNHHLSILYSSDPTAIPSGYGRRRGRRRRRIWILLSMTERHCYSSSFRSPSLLYFTFVFLSRAFVVDHSQPAELFWIHVKCAMNIMIWKRPLTNLICQSLQANLDCIYRGDNANVDELNIMMLCGC